MVRNIWDRIKRVGSCTGIEISLLADDALAINGVILHAKGTRVRKEKELSLLSSYEELTARTGTSRPLAVSVNGRGLLHKKLPAGDLKGHPIEMILPNANPHEFYHAVTRLENFTLVSVIRKEVLDKIVTNLQNKGFRLLSLSIGPSDIQYLTSFLTAAGNTPVVGSTNFQFLFSKDGQLTDIIPLAGGEDSLPDKEEYNIGDQYVRSPALLAFGSAIGLLASGPEDTAVFEHASVAGHREEYRYFRYYRAALWTLLSTLLVILLVNFFVYNYYFSRNTDLQYIQMVGRGQEEKAKRMEASLRWKEAFLSQYGWETSSRLSFFADRMAGLVPAGTLLTCMKLYPSRSTLLGEGHGIRFKRDTIEVTGACDDPTELNQFTNNLKNLPMFREVSIRNYAYKKETQSGNFLMEVITN